MGGHAVNRRRLPALWILSAVPLVASLWALWPAWQAWQAHPPTLQTLAQQRQALQFQLQEAEALRQKPIPSSVEAQNLIQSISKKHLGSTPLVLPGQGLQIQINGVSADRLALGWQEIRSLTSASVVRADLTAQADLWSGTLVFKLAQKP